MICYSCGDLVKDTDIDALVCLTCSVNYCSKCFEPEDRCQICGNPLEELASVQLDYFNPSELLAEVISSEKREQPRSKIELRCAYTMRVRRGAEVRNEEYKALTHDISATGICFYSRTALHVGQTVSIDKCSAFTGSRTAVVRWVKKGKNHIYLSGLMFS
ncbi:MAG: PilZ domain-containing protein [Nitrospirota bacterium]|nr:MAG: PilZ domain-containing protein [Nitrospirota bacterium]